MNGRDLLVEARNEIALALGTAYGIRALDTTTDDRVIGVQVDRLHIELTITAATEYREVRR